MSIVAPSSLNAWMCGSSRRRPITSPPGGGIVARPKRASSGPASRNDARILLQSAGVGRRLRRRPARRRAPRSARPRRVGAEVGEQLEHRVDVADARHVRQRHRLVREQAGGEDRQRAVLVAGGADACRSGGRRPSMTNASASAGATAIAGYASRAVAPDSRTGLADAHDVHEERIAASSRARGGGVDGGVRAEARRRRGAVARRGAPPRLRLRDPPDARQAPAGRRADPARGGLSRRRSSRPSSRMPSTCRCRATRR